MSKPGRNDPCPCGSGRKYKVCCLGKEVVRLGFTAAERQSALASLEWFAWDYRLVHGRTVCEDLLVRDRGHLRSGELLKAMENGSDRDRRDGRLAYDFSWMWDQLGPTRPG